VVNVADENVAAKVNEREIGEWGPGAVSAPVFVLR
jgi:hypothetical protein